MAIQFYDSMSKVVNKLILRNSKRLQKELSDSKELMALNFQIYGKGPQPGGEEKNAAISL